MTFLLDVNVLIALVDASHVSHDAAHAWFAREGRRNWATCPITENGLIRIIANPKYPNALATPADAVALLEQLASLPGHVFWPDDVSLRDAAFFNLGKIMTVGQITDSYLLALAAAKGGRLANSLLLVAG
ncbi:MAG: VapC toxin family PIN domain ribonuclease [Hyphomicrobiales bacterium]|nr:VapC toxin family PIN domain ribonuclease [Hyphomicrobiales bacterium]